MDIFNQLKYYWTKSRLQNKVWYNFRHDICMVKQICIFASSFEKLKQDC